MKLLYLLAICLTVDAARAIEPEFTTVFVSGEHGYPLIRTPQILVTAKGMCLAFAQGWMGEHDQSANDIVLKRSEDGGRTWSPLAVIAEDGDHSLNSICVLQVRETGRILVVGCILPAGHVSREYPYLSPAMQEYYRNHGRDKWPVIQPGFGPSAARVYSVHSDDDGQTWSPICDISKQAMPADAAMWCVPGPGIGIQLQRGPHAGRIVIPCNRLWLENEAYHFTSHAIYSDDLGQSWQYGDLARTPADGWKGGNPNETQMVELPDGRVMLNARSIGRVTAVSSDGAHSWGLLQEEPALVGPATAAGFLRFSQPSADSSGLMLYSAPRDDGRNTGVIYLSRDDGQTWPISRVLREGRFGYSCLTRLPDDQIDCIFESRQTAAAGEVPQGRKVVALARFPLTWLTGEAD